MKKQPQHTAYVELFDVKGKSLGEFNYRTKCMKVHHAVAQLRGLRGSGDGTTVEEQIADITGYIHIRLFLWGNQWAGSRLIDFTKAL